LSQKDTELEVDFPERKANGQNISVSSLLREPLPKDLTKLKLIVKGDYMMDGDNLKKWLNPEPPLPALTQLALDLTENKRIRDRDLREACDRLQLTHLDLILNKNVEIDDDALGELLRGKKDSLTHLVLDLTDNVTITSHVILGYAFDELPLTHLDLILKKNVNIDDRALKKVLWEHKDNLTHLVLDLTGNVTITSDSVESLRSLKQLTHLELDLTENGNITDAIFKRGLPACLTHLTLKLSKSSKISSEGLKALPDGVKGLKSLTMHLKGDSMGLKVEDIMVADEVEVNCESETGDWTIDARKEAAAIV